MEPPVIVNRLTKTNRIYRLKYHNKRPGVSRMREFIGPVQGELN
jgi:hypothetical protein